jgi:hypothetical protein
MELIGYLTPKIDYCFTVLMASTTKFAKKVGSILMSLEDIDVFAQLLKAY